MPQVSVLDTAFLTTWKMTQKCEGPQLKVILSGVSFVTCGQ